MKGQTDRPVLVLGGGPAGLAASCQAAATGRSVLLVEKADRLGGLPREMACKATDSCARCGVCLVDDLLTEARARENIEIRLNTRLAGVETDVDRDLSVNLVGQGGQVDRKRVAGIIVAVGGRPIRPEIKSQFGHGRLEDVISGLELEAMLRRASRLVRPSDGEQARKVVFIQCVGSRDISLEGGGNTECSRICCGYTARLATWIKAHDPGAEVSVFYMDLQSFGRTPSGPIKTLEGKVEYLRSVPGYIVPGSEGRVVVSFKPEYEAGLSEKEADLVILSTGLQGPEDGRDLAEILGLKLDGNGFLEFTGSERILVTGAAGGPLGIAESVRQGRLAGLAAGNWVGGDHESV